MDSIKLEKYQATKIYSKYNNLFLPSLIRSSLLLVMLGLFLSSPLWLPTLCSSIMPFFIESLPRIIEIILSPKSLFLVFNLIIIFLVGQSRISHSSRKPNVYEEYVTRSKGLNGLPSREYKGNDLADNDKKEERDYEDKQETGVEMEDEDVTVEKNNEALEDDEEEREERGLPAEELNKRVEDFIARVNMQRSETRMLVCCG